MAVDTGFALAETGNPAQVRGRPHADLLLAIALVVLGTLASVGILLAINPAFFFYDDMEHQHVPVMMEIGRQLRAGHFPAVTDLSSFGGNLSGEYQYALFNPVSLLIYYVLPSFSDLSNAAALLGISHYLILAVGVFLLALEVGARPLAAALAALMMVTNPFLAHWYACSWIPGLVGTAWVPWALAALHRSAKDARFIPLGVLAVFLVDASGWPQAVLGMGVTALILFFMDSGLPRKRVHGGWVALIAGCLASLPVWLPLLAFSQMSLRGAATSISDLNALLAPPLQALLNVGFPTQLFVMNGLGGVEMHWIPIAYAGIPLLILPALVQPQWWRSNFRPLLGWLVVAAFFLVLTMGPSRLGPMRWPIRFLPHCHLALSILVAVVLTRAPLDPSPAALKRALIWCVVALFFAWQSSTAEAFYHLLAFGSIFATGLAIWRFQNDARVPAIALMAMTLISWLFMSVIHQRNMNLHELGAPTDIADYKLPPTVSPDDITLTVIYPRFTFSGVEHGIYSGATNLLAGMKSINGYSPLSPEGLARGLDLNQFGWILHGTTNLNRIDPDTGMSTVQLLGVTRILVDKADNRMTMPQIDTANTICFDGVHLRVHCLPRAEHAPITWASRPIQTSVLEQSPARVRIAVTVGAGGAEVVVARTWFPGIHAELNGQPIDLIRYKYDLVKAKLPQVESGTLEITWGYPDLAKALGALVAALVFMIVGYRWARPRDGLLLTRSQRPLI